jgi:hypothetical protein
MPHFSLIAKAPRPFQVGSGFLSVKRLGKKLGRISVEELDQVIDGSNEIIGS